MCSSLSLLLLSTDFVFPKSPFNSTSLSGLSFFAVVLFHGSYSYSSLPLLCSPFFSSSSSLSNMIEVLGFVLCLVPSSLSDSKIGSEWLMLVLRLCPFASEFFNCYMMEFIFLHLLGWLLVKLLGALYLNMAVVAGSSVGFLLKDFK